jgi:hypothetical protein
MKPRLRGSASIATVLFIVSGITTSALGYRQYERVTTEPAWVVNQFLSKGDVINRSDLLPVRLDKSLVQNSIQNPNVLVGKKLINDKQTGEPIHQWDITQPKGQSLSSAIPSGRVLYTLKYPRSATPISKLNAGDRFDIITRGQGRIRTVARDVQLIGVVHPDGASNQSENSMTELLQVKPKSAGVHESTALVMAVRPVDVYPLASIGNSDNVSIILHSAHDVANGLRQNVDPEQIYREVEVVSGLDRKKVRINM